MTPAERLVNALKLAPGAMTDAIWRVPGQAGLPVRVSDNASVEAHEIGNMPISVFVNFAWVHSSDVGEEVLAGTQVVIAGTTYDIQVLPTRDSSGWHKIGLVKPKARR